MLLLSAAARSPSAEQSLHCPAARHLQVLIPAVVCEKGISLVFCCTVFRRLKFHQGPLAKAAIRPTLIPPETTLAPGGRGWSPPGKLQGELSFLRKTKVSTTEQQHCRGTLLLQQQLPSQRKPRVLLLDFFSVPRDT